MVEKEKCPYCSDEINIDEIDVNCGMGDGYGDFKVYFDCPHCGKEIVAYFEDGRGYDFKYLSK